MLEFYGEAFKSVCSERPAEIHIDGRRYNILPNTLIRFKGCSSAKEYVEAVERFAYDVLVLGAVENDGFFEMVVDGEE